MRERQCRSCGGFCNKSGCERENVKPLDRIIELEKQLKVVMHQQKLDEMDAAHWKKKYEMACWEADRLEALAEHLANKDKHTINTNDERNAL